MTEPKGPPPSKHHYVPVFYLKGFTADGRRDTQVYVLDLKTRRQWSTKPENAACEKGYNTVGMKDGGDPESWEKAMASLEGVLAPVLARTIENQSLPEGEDFDLLLNLIALMVLYSPSLRTFSQRMADDMVRQAAQDIVATPEAYERLVRKVRAEDKEMPIFPYEGMKKFLQNGCDFDVNLGPNSNYHLGTMAHLSKFLVPYLAERHWSLVVATADAPDLICSDNVVSISPIAGSCSTGELGFAAKETFLFFPLNRRMAMVGSYEGFTLPNPMKASTVALVNSSTARHADRFLFSPSPDFVWRDANNEIRDAAYLLANLPRS